MTQAPARCTPTPNVTLTSAPRDPGDVSPVVTTARRGLDGPGVINGRGVTRELWRRVEARCERQGWVASVVGWWTCWADRTNPSLQGFLTPTAVKAFAWPVSSYPGEARNLDLGRDAHNGLFGAVPIDASSPFRGRWSHQGPKIIEVKGVDSKPRQTGFKSQL